MAAVARLRHCVRPIAQGRSTRIAPAACMALRVLGFVVVTAPPGGQPRASGGIQAAISLRSRFAPAGCRGDSMRRCFQRPAPCSQTLRGSIRLIVTRGFNSYVKDWNGSAGQEATAPFVVVPSTLRSESAQRLTTRPS
jgi:hypothetical protein